MTQPNPQQIIVYSTTWCGDCRRSKRWLKDNNIPFTEIDIEQDAPAADHVRQLNHGSATVPTIVFPDGAILAEPSNAALALQVEKSLGTTTPDAERARSKQ
jgi:mycoredoxin